MGMILNPAAVTRIRTERGLRKGELARLMGRAPSYISELESGRKQNPSPAVIRELADALGVEPRTLLVEDERVAEPRQRLLSRDKLVATPAEAAPMIGTSVAGVHKLIKEGRLPHIRYGKRRVVIPWMALTRWLEAEAERSTEDEA